MRVMQVLNRSGDTTLDLDDLQGRKLAEDEFDRLVLNGSYTAMLMDGIQGRPVKDPAAEKDAILSEAEKVLLMPRLQGG